MSGKPKPAAGTAEELRELTREAHAAAKDLNAALREGRRLLQTEVPALARRQIHDVEAVFRARTADLLDQISQLSDKAMQDLHDAQARLLRFESQQALLDHIIVQMQTAIREVARTLIREYDMFPAQALEVLGQPAVTIMAGRDARPPLPEVPD